MGGCDVEPRQACGNFCVWFHCNFYDVNINYVILQWDLDRVRWRQTRSNIFASLDLVSTRCSSQCLPHSTALVMDVEVEDAQDIVTRPAKRFKVRRCISVVM